MLSQIELNLPQPTTTPSFDEVKNLSKFPLKMAQAHHITAQEGTLLMQSVSHYLAHIQLYEYRISDHYIIDFEVPEPSFFITAIIEGRSVLHNESGEVISEIAGNTCRLTYLAAGKYQQRLIVGDHKMLIIALKPEWLTNKYGDHEEMRDFIASYNIDGKQSMSLPDFNLAPHAFNALKKLNEGKDFDIDIHLFTNDCLKRYLNKLQAKTVNASYQETKAKEIAEFINQNFTTKIVDDEDELARRFMTSKITLTRLAKRHFGRPLHKQVIELRMLTALKMLMLTKKTIQEIAQHIGYEDSHYFSRAFKKRFGVSPNEVRISTLRS
ncbi:helix-turn-helix transcriptional regulator [Pedobacter nyackensis]|uniref:AraC-type DNA-binding protein n=1 Tax=Pedobacter nyackensis TaxID=475255 RepID=A0A1W2DKL0_9SPHI|nr:helix-turn-helix transcriptional regulator [Pedobacter nyackensis]SMC98060.1 AraC-type DNA-binding protein [Pedobacter nyackensis]